MDDLLPAFALMADQFLSEESPFQCVAPSLSALAERCEGDASTEADKTPRRTDITEYFVKD